MKISIVTISFNQSRYIKKCIDSVLNQKNVEIEYIVVDPGSNDGSREIINSYGDRLIKIYQPDKGPADGLNKGFQMATGEIFGFINSDDYFLEGSLQKVKNYFLENQKKTYITGHGWIEDNRRGKKYRMYPSTISKLKYAYDASKIFQQGTFFPAEFFYAAGGFNEMNNTCWDGELFANFANLGLKHKVINEDLAVFRIYSGSISGSYEVNAKYQADKNRIFKFLMGREINYLDKIIISILRPIFFILKKIKSTIYECENKH